MAKLKYRTAFDDRLEARKGHIPAAFSLAAIEVNDTMELATSITQQSFEGAPFTGADIIAIYDRILARMEGTKE